MKFFVSNRVLQAIRVPPVFQRAKRLLDATRDGELLLITQLSARVRSNPNYLQQHFNFFLPGYKHTYNNKSYFGKPATINQLKKEFKRS